MLATTTVAIAQQNIQPTVSVTGEGKVHVVPDRATITVKVENEGEQATSVKTENDTAVDAVLKLLKKMKLDSKDYQTQYVNLNKNYDYQTKEYKYVATQTITINLKDLSKYESLMQGLLTSGVNRIDNVSFESSKIETLKAEARIKAVENAKSKAVAYAGVLDQKIGKAITISEASNAIHQPVPMFKTMAVNDVAVSESMETLAIGEMEVSAKINIIFELQ